MKAEAADFSILVKKKTKLEQNRRTTPAAIPNASFICFVIAFYLADYGCQVVSPGVRRHWDVNRSPCAVIKKFV